MSDRRDAISELAWKARRARQTGTMVVLTAEEAEAIVAAAHAREGAAVQRVLDEALNSGDGVYRP